jgi:hypothetical protein
VTAGACPLPAANIVAKVAGAGFPAGGQNVVGNSSAGVSSYGPFEVFPIYTFSQMVPLMERPQPLRGSYRFVVTCRTAQNPTSYRDYATTVRFASPHHWVATEPPSDVATVAQVSAAQAKAQSLQQTAPSSQAGSSSRLGPNPSTGATKAAVNPVRKITEHANRRGRYVALLLLGLAIAAVSGVVLWRRRDRNRKPPSSDNETRHTPLPEPVSR